MASPSQEMDRVSLHEFAQALDDVQVGTLISPVAVAAGRKAQDKIIEIIRELRDTADSL